MRLDGKGRADTMGNVKLKDIADALQVSTVTVSNALAGKKGVSDEVRETVLRTARSMGYNLSKYEKGKDSTKIGVLAPDKYMGVGSSFYWALYQQVIYAASKSRSLTMLEILDEENEEANRFPRMVQENMIDGLIVIGWVKQDYIRKLVKKSDKLPILLLDSRIRDIPCDAVLSHNYIGMYQMTRYLLERGHTGIAFAGSIRDNDNIMDRYFGYRKALLEAGIPVRKEWRLEDRNLLTGEVRVGLPKQMPTAFACSSDLAAGRLYDALTEKGYRVPEDISIVGYDDYLFGHPFAGQLTTYHVDLEEMAENAVKLLLGKIRGEEKKCMTLYADGGIVERESVKTLELI